MPHPSSPNRLATAARWPFGIGVTAWTYVWRVTPMHRREGTGSWARDGAPPLPPDVERERIHGPADGAGPLLHPPPPAGGGAGPHPGPGGGRGPPPAPPLPRADQQGAARPGGPDGPAVGRPEPGGAGRPGALREGRGRRGAHGGRRRVRRPH